MSTMGAIDPEENGLGLLKDISPVFHVDQLSRAAEDPRPRQKLYNEQPPPIITREGNEEQFVKEILCARTEKGGRGYRRLVLVKGEKFADNTWEPLENFQKTEALDRFEEKYEDAKINDESLRD
ncbi:hypothetical protein K3495_g2269 [Podosphaera aphanis]|nr:hypothetical protein K3495_g2269 [Podosphaera aphanis]